MNRMYSLRNTLNQRDVEVANALRQVVEQFNRIGREVAASDAPASQQDFLVMVAPLVVTEIARLTADTLNQGRPGSTMAWSDAVPGWRLLVTAGDDVVIESPKDGPGAMTIPPDGGSLAVQLLRDLVKTLAQGSLDARTFSGQDDGMSSGVVLQ